MPTPPAITAVLLAGGRASRMGGVDKGLIEFHGTPLVERICAALAPQVAEILINANRNLPRYEQLGYAVVPDQIGGHQGPLAGMHAALHAASHEWLLTLPCDGPYLTKTYAARMLRAATAEQVPLAIAHDGEYAQPVYTLLHRSLTDSLGEFLQTSRRKIADWHAQHPSTTVDFSDTPALFTNVNTPQQLAELEQAPP